MTPAEKSRLESIADSSPSLLFTLSSALSAVLPHSDRPPLLHAADAGHWVYPMILVADWLQREASPETIASETAAIRQAYHDYIASIAERAAADRAYNLTGKAAAAAARKALTASLLKDLSL